MCSTPSSRCRGRGGHRWTLLARLLFLASARGAGRAVLSSDTSGDSPPRDVILGAEYNVREVELRIFLSSLRSSGCRADVVLFCGRRQDHTESLAQRFGAEVILYDFDTLNRTHGPVGVHRFYLYRKFLEERSGRYARVLHTDVRDVMFQDDPFERIDAFGGGVFFLESNHLLIGTSPTNRGWMTDNCTTYKKEGMLERTQHRLRSCSGNFFGTADAAYWYARLMEEEQQRTASAERDHSGAVIANGWCADQAIHQGLLWTGRFAEHMANVTTFFNEDGPLCTMGDVVQISVDEYGEVRNSARELYAVVHQYDRHKRVRDTLAARYDDPDAPQHLHPSYTPGYEDVRHTGDLAAIRHHLDVDTSMPPVRPSSDACPTGTEASCAADSL